MGLKRQVAGQPFNPSASTWNTFVDMAEAAGQDESNSSESQLPPSKQPAIIWIKNASGSDLARFCALKLDEPIFTQDDNENEFLNRIAFSAVKLEGKENETIVILQEPLADGKIGKAMIMGATVVKIEILDEGHKYATYSDAHPEYLKSSSSATNQRLIFNPGTDKNYGIVLLNAIPPSKLSYTQIVQVTNKGSDDWGLYDIVGVSSPQNLPIDDGPAWFESLPFDGYRLDNATLSMGLGLQLGITQEPIKQGETGRVCIRGITMALMTYPNWWLTMPGTIFSLALEWLHVWKCSGGSNKWTFYPGRAGDVRLVSLLFKDQSDFFDDRQQYLVLVDLCDVPNRFFAYNSGTSLPPHSVCSAQYDQQCGVILTNINFPLFSGSSDICASPGWTMGSHSYGWCYKVTPDTPVCIAGGNSVGGLYGPVQGEKKVWPYVPGLLCVDEQQYVSGLAPFDMTTLDPQPPTYGWFKKALDQVIYAKATANCYLTRVAGHWPQAQICSSDGSIVYNGTSQFGTTYPNILVNNNIDSLTRYQYPNITLYPCRYPNIQANQVFMAHVSDGYGLIPADPLIYDDPIGTVKMWNLATGSIPAGWREYNAMKDKFPVGVGYTIAGAVGSTGGALTHTHPSGTGIASGSNLGAANHLPPYSGIIFIERYQ